MIASLRQLFSRSIRARLIAMISAIVVSIVCLLTLVIALLEANILRHESDRQLSQSLEQSGALFTASSRIRGHQVNRNEPLRYHQQQR